MGRGGFLKYIGLGIFSGLCSFLFINCVTRVVSLIISGDLTSISQEYIVVFAAIILFFIWTRRTLSIAIIYLSQTLFWNLRKQILALALNANYQQLSDRKTQIRSAIVSDVNILTNASLTIINFFTSGILAICCLIYLSTISLLLFLITLVVALIGVSVYHLTSKRNIQNFQKARELENRFQESFTAILNGFKEIYMEPKIGRFIFNQKIKEISREACGNTTTAYTRYLNNQITGQILFYILISSILLCFSLILKIKPTDTVNFVFTLLYLLSSIEQIMVLLPGIVRARVASNRLMDLKKEMETTEGQNPIPERYVFKHSFERVTVRNLEFHYEEDKGFRVGPISLAIEKGEVVFIYGGNGSGKTTFVHAVIGLRIPSAGEIRLNNTLVDKDNYPDYRAVFAVVFSDFYLFDELVGVDEVDAARFNYYLELFELEGKVQIEQGRRFSTVDLSTGQRKRLALIAALLQDKPVLVIDEWAADQDPYFRKKFYTEVIPLLKQEGRTIIAITHDDKYYHCADKLYKMDYGRLVAENVTAYGQMVTQ